MRILILGAGAIGGYFGGRIAEAGGDVTFLVRPRRREQLEQDGLRVTSPLGSIERRVRTVLAEELRPDFDLVLLTCKAYDLESAMDAIAPAVTGECVVVPMLNGMSHMERLDARFGRQQVMGGTCQVNTMLRQDGVIEHTLTLQRIAFGERDGRVTPRAQTFASVLAATTIDWELSPNIMLAMWEKLSFLCTLAAMTCLFRGTIGEILSAPGGGEAIERTYLANLEIARREGFPPRDEAIALARKMLLTPGSKSSASLLRDMEAGGRTEADHIVGWMLLKAREHGIDDLMLSLAYTHLKTYEARRSAGRLS